MVLMIPMTWRFGKSLSFPMLEDNYPPKQRYFCDFNDIVLNDDFSIAGDEVTELEIREDLTASGCGCA